jgi:hypothetical protein
MHRPTVGILTIVVFVLGLGLTFLGTGDEQHAWGAGLLRVSLALGALWLALPELRRLPAWMLVLAVGLLVVLARWPRHFFVALFIALAFAILRPRAAKAQGREASSTSTPNRQRGRG